MIHHTDFVVNDPAYQDRYREISEQTWPVFIQNSKVVQSCWERLLNYFPENQLVCFNEKKELVGFIHTIPFYRNCALEELPDEGWDWMIQKGISDHENGVEPNCLGGLEILIDPKFREQGYSKQILEVGKELFRKSGHSHFILPIRPTFKHLHPKMSMESYMDWKEDGKIYDPWIRIHKNSGATMIRVCTKSMIITGTKEDWSSWTGIDMTRAGEYVIKGALEPVVVQEEDKLYSYEEDNIWLYYS